MLNDTDWLSWLNSNETRAFLDLLKGKQKELQEGIVSGFLLQHDQVDKIAVDYAHKVGVLEGLSEAIKTIEEIVEYERRSDT